MDKIIVKIAGTGSYLPARVVPNEEIAPRMNSNAEWIFSHTGIASRHVAAADESCSSMATKAAQAALESAKASPDDIGLLILATTTPDYDNIPATACVIQHALGCNNECASFDLVAACSGFMYGLEMARGYLQCHPDRKALIIGSEILSRSMDWSDRSLAMLFGDGAGAAVVEGVPAKEGDRVFTVTGSDGSGGSYIAHEGGFRKPFTEDPTKETVKQMDIPYLTMEGHAVFTFAVRKMPEIVMGLCERAGLQLTDLDLIIPHQANSRIIEAVARRMGLPLEKFFMNLDKVGNTSGASIPICLDEAVRTGVLKDGMTISLTGFGSGLTWAGALMKWPYISI